MNKRGTDLPVSIEINQSKPSIQQDDSFHGDSRHEVAGIVTIGSP